ncbi:hypothetical protein Cgig2_026695 [Carnegiea gigantea]|uniref:Uncharacterized protein n=1 Tax=Carnegiea gigantea TaxID=171969 RepID=A0A9Q1JR59_9CARY|nr:hypothetical protein Cgig2_026695 [Carnegiea gigantea]
MLQKRKKELKKTDAHQNICKTEQEKGEKTMHKSDDEVLVKRIKKIKQGSKFRPKKMQLRAKKCVKSQPEKKEDIQKSPKPPVKSPKSMQSEPKPAEGDSKYKIFQSRISPSRFVSIIANFNEAQRKAIQDMGFGGFLHLQVIKLSGDLCKWLVDRFDPYSVTLYISPDKRIEITPMDVHITLALPIGGRKVEEFCGKKPKDAKYNEVLDA